VSGQNRLWRYATRTGFYGVRYGTGEALSPANQVRLRSTLRSASRGIIGGPRVELHLPRGFSLQVDALHRAIRSQENSTIAVDPATAATRNSGHFYQQTHATWEFPVLAKYRFQLGRVRPFVEAGPAFRPARNVSGLSNHGATAAAGVETRLGKLRVAPQLRYTRWARDRDRDTYLGIPRTRTNEVTALAGEIF
jgi:hypothetical protein